MSPCLLAYSPIAPNKTQQMCGPFNSYKNWAEDFFRFSFQRIQQVHQILIKIPQNVSFIRSILRFTETTKNPPFQRPAPRQERQVSGWTLVACPRVSQWPDEVHSNLHRLTWLEAPGHDAVDAWDELMGSDLEGERSQQPVSLWDIWYLYAYISYIYILYIYIFGWVNKHVICWDVCREIGNIGWGTVGTCVLTSKH